LKRGEYFWRRYMWTRLREGGRTGLPITRLFKALHTMNI